MEGNYFDFTSDWWERREQDNIHILMYNDLVSNTRVVVEKLAEFCGKSLEESQIDRLCQWIRVTVDKEEGRKPGIHKDMYNEEQMVDLQMFTYCRLAYRGLLFR